jgi:gamma-glutamylaminecyclotransferase
MNPMSAGDSFILFVYGTLMRGGVRHRLLADQRFLGKARTLPRYGLYDLGAYPGMVHRDEDGCVVVGELYQVAVSRIPQLDAEEGAPTLFRLEPVAVEGRDEPVSAYLYQRSVEGSPLCSGGRWIHKDQDR